MTDPLAKLRALVAFDTARAVKMSEPWNAHPTDNVFVGIKRENARLQPAIEALLKVAEAAKTLIAGLDAHVEDWRTDAPSDDYGAQCALALDEALRGLDLEAEERK